MQAQSGLAQWQATSPSVSQQFPQPSHAPGTQWVPSSSEQQAATSSWVASGGAAPYTQTQQQLWMPQQQQQPQQLPVYSAQQPGMLPAAPMQHPEYAAQHQGQGYQQQSHQFNSAVPQQPYPGAGAPYIPPAMQAQPPQQQVAQYMQQQPGILPLPAGSKQQAGPGYPVIPRLAIPQHPPVVSVQSALNNAYYGSAGGAYQQPGAPVSARPHRRTRVTLDPATGHTLGYSPRDNESVMPGSDLAQAQQADGEHQRVLAVAAKHQQQAAMLTTLPPHLQTALPPSPQELEAIGAGGTHPLYGPLYTKPIPPDILSVTVQHMDTIRPGDPMITNPVVRLHVLDPATGDYMRNLSLPGIQLDPHKQAMMLRFPGRPNTVTVSSGPGGGPHPALQEYIPPVQTAPYSLLRREDQSNAPVWHEPLLVDEALERLLALDALLLFEVLQLPVNYHRYNKHPKEFNSGTHRVAWAFLRLAGPPADPMAGAQMQQQQHLRQSQAGLMSPGGGGVLGGGVTNEHHMMQGLAGGRRPLLGSLKLQLYEYKQEPLLSMRTPQPSGQAVSAPTAAFASWQALMSSREAAGRLSLSDPVPKYPAALHITVDAVPRPEPSIQRTDPSRGIRPILPAGYGSGFEEGSVPVHQFLLQTFGAGASALGGSSLLGPGASVLAGLEASRYYRPRTDPCKVPNTLLRKLSTGAGGATCVAFNHDGSLLAVAAGDEPNGDLGFKILLYNTLSGAEVARLHSAHHGWVHSLAWSPDDRALASASADGTAKIWELALFSPATKTIRPRVLRHPCFVYSVAFHPQQKTYPAVVTGAHDGKLRVWHRFGGHLVSEFDPHRTAAKAGGTGPSSTPSTEGPAGGHVNAVVFDTLGSRLWAGDSHGVIQELSFDSAAAAAALATPPATAADLAFQHIPPPPGYDARGQPVVQGDVQGGTGAPVLASEPTLSAPLPAGVAVNTSGGLQHQQQPPPPYHQGLPAGTQPWQQQPQVSASQQQSPPYQQQQAPLYQGQAQAQAQPGPGPYWSPAPVTGQGMPQGDAAAVLSGQAGRRRSTAGGFWMPQERQSQAGAPQQQQQLLQAVMWGPQGQQQQYQAPQQQYQSPQQQYTPQPVPGYPAPSPPQGPYQQEQVAGGVTQGMPYSTAALSAPPGVQKLASQVGGYSPPPGAFSPPPQQPLIYQPLPEPVKPPMYQPLPEPLKPAGQGQPYSTFPSTGFPEPIKAGIKWEGGSIGGAPAPMMVGGGRPLGEGTEQYMGAGGGMQGYGMAAQSQQYQQGVYSGPGVVPGPYMAPPPPPGAQNYGQPDPHMQQPQPQQYTPPQQQQYQQHFQQGSYPQAPGNYLQQQQVYPMHDHVSNNQGPPLPVSQNYAPGAGSLSQAAQVVPHHQGQQGYPGGDVYPPGAGVMAGGQYIPVQQHQNVVPGTVQGVPAGPGVVPGAGPPPVPAYPPRPPVPPPGPVLRPMRTSTAFAGERIASMSLHPGGRKLLVLTRSSRLASLDTKDFKEGRDLGSLRCKSALIKPCVSPDGSYVLGGGEDGKVGVWDADTFGDTPTPLPHASFSGPTQPVMCAAWNPSLHMVALAAWGSWAPVLVAVHDPDLPPVQVLSEGPEGAAARSMAEAALRRRAKAATSTKRLELPDKLTPALVHALLKEVRSDARKRGILATPTPRTQEQDQGQAQQQQQQYTYYGQSRPSAQAQQQHLVAGHPNERGAYGRPGPDPATDQVVIRRPDPLPQPTQQELDRAQRQADKVAEDARAAQRLDVSLRPHAHTTASEQDPPPTLTLPVKSHFGQQGQPPSTSQQQQQQGAPAAGTTPAQGAYSPSLAGAVPEGTTQGPRWDAQRAAASAAALLDPPPRPDGVAPPPAGQYAPNLSRGDLPQGQGAKGEEALLRGAPQGVAGTGSSTRVVGPAEEALLTGKARPMPVHQMPEVAGQAYAAAAPPQPHPTYAVQPLLHTQQQQQQQQQLRSPMHPSVDIQPGGPVMVGPGATVIVGPGATVVMREGAEVVEEGAANKGWAPNVATRPYDIHLNQPLAAAAATSPAGAASGQGAVKQESVRGPQQQVVAAGMSGGAGKGQTPTGAQAPAAAPTASASPAGAVPAGPTASRDFDPALLKPAAPPAPSAHTPQASVAAPAAPKAAAAQVHPPASEGLQSVGSAGYGSELEATLSGQGGVAKISAAVASAASPSPSSSSSDIKATTGKGSDASIATGPVPGAAAAVKPGSSPVGVPAGGKGNDTTAAAGTAPSSASPGGSPPTAAASPVKGSSAPSAGTTAGAPVGTASPPAAAGHSSAGTPGAPASAQGSAPSSPPKPGDSKPGGASPTAFQGGAAAAAGGTGIEDAGKPVPTGPGGAPVQGSTGVAAAASPTPPAEGGAGEKLKAKREAVIAATMSTPSSTPANAGSPVGSTAQVPAGTSPGSKDATAGAGAAPAPANGSAATATKLGTTATPSPSTSPTSSPQPATATSTSAGGAAGSSPAKLPSPAPPAPAPAAQPTVSTSTPLQPAAPDSPAKVASPAPAPPPPPIVAHGVTAGAGIK